MSSDTPVIATSAKRIAPDDGAHVPAPKIRVGKTADELVLLIFNEDGSPQAMQLQYDDIPADFVTRVRDRLHKKGGTSLFEGRNRDPIFRQLMVMIGMSEPSDPAEHPIHDQFDWNDGDDFQQLKQLYKTVPVIMHPGWFLNAPSGAEPHTFVKCDVVLLQAFF